ncbi:putative RING finger protein [Paramyrothecium foliicola]|nr:putative RING finger protein [Paramyrothecium foliicola]
MKFAHSFKDSLASQNFPSHWVDQAIPYGQLKKCLKHVTRELQEYGLDPETLRALLKPSEESSPVALTYHLKLASPATAESHQIRPRLTVTLHLQDGVVVDASLTPASRRFLDRIVHDLSNKRKPDSEPNPEPSTIEPTADIMGESISATRPPGALQGGYETIELPLVFDGEFFAMLQNDVDRLDELQAQERQNMAAVIEELGKEVSSVSQPSRFSRTDLARWRHIFELYLDAQVFFATNEQDHGLRSSQTALKQLQWFQNEVEKRQLAKGFKLRESRVAFTRFLNLNASLLTNLQFQELNRLAVYKILKKFDKRTSLGVSAEFPTALRSDRLLTGSIAKDICSEISQNLVSVVPQINDYLCPVCFSIAYRPVRLACQHIFCIRCVVKIQRRRERHCPLCRADVVMDACLDNLDWDLAKYLKKYFPKEVKEKQHANEVERYIEDYGVDYVNQPCTIILVEPANPTCAMNTN